MTDKPENPPAFPRPLGVSHGGVGEHQYVNDEQDGMTLRDYFAAAALTGMVSFLGDVGAGNTATFAYEYADAMLKARAE